MSHHFKIKKGLDIPLEGAPSGQVTTDLRTTLYGIVPDDFPGHTWKARVKPGDTVKRGSCLLSDKETDSIRLVSPVAGTVREIRRGERRKILAVTVEAFHEGERDESEKFDTAKNPETIRKTLLESGLWAMMRQRPFDTVPQADSVPRDIFITAFDSAPLTGPMLNVDDLPYLEEGVAVLATLTQGKVYIGTRPGSGLRSNAGEINEFEGPHPAGNVGVQIAAIRPVNKGETVWTLSARTACRIGRLFRDGHLDCRATVAVTGPEVENPHLVDTLVGAYLPTLLKGFIPEGKEGIRVISGNVLTGWTVNEKEDFLRYPYRQVTVISEGNHADEFMGWASMKPTKFSVKRTFPAFLRGLAKPFPFDARIKGGHRAMILSEEYDKVFPFDIYPEYLLKAILAGDIDRMEKLGIYEVAPEDFALPEFVDTSKIELQKAVREGLDKVRLEG